MTLEEALAQIEALKKKNEEILGEKKAAAKKVEEAEAGRKKAEEEKAEAERAAEEAEARKAGDIRKLEDTLNKKHAAELKARDDQIAALQKAVGELEAARDALVLDGGLRDAVEAAGVAEAFRPAVLALLKSKGAKVETKDGQFLAMIGDKPLQEAVKAFAESDEGKHFVANGNSGGGAPGTPKAAAGGGEPNPYAQGTVNKTRQGWLEKHDPAKANKFRQAAGLPTLP